MDKMNIIENTVLPPKYSIYLDDDGKYLIKDKKLNKDKKLINGWYYITLNTRKSKFSQSQLKSAVETGIGIYNKWTYNYYYMICRKDSMDAYYDSRIGACRCHDCKPELPYWDNPRHWEFPGTCPKHLMEEEEDARNLV